MDRKKFELSMKSPWQQSGTTISENNILNEYGLTPDQLVGVSTTYRCSFIIFVGLDFRERCCMGNYYYAYLISDVKKRAIALKGDSFFIKEKEKELKDVRASIKALQSQENRLVQEIKSLQRQQQVKGMEISFLQLSLVRELN
jgi:hypothetical protein